jgi:hypothetical protein
MENAPDGNLCLFFNFRYIVNASFIDYDGGWQIMECYVDYIYYLAKIHNRNEALVY